MWYSNVNELIEKLMENDLRQFEFTVFSRYNEDDDKEYTFTLRGSIPSVECDTLCNIGGYEENVTVEEIEQLIDRAEEDMLFGRSF